MLRWCRAWEGRAWEGICPISTRNSPLQLGSHLVEEREGKKGRKNINNFSMARMAVHEDLTCVVSPLILPRSLATSRPCSRAAVPSFPPL
jgi:hypothetical protein